MAAFITGVVFSTLSDLFCMCYLHIYALVPKFRSPRVQNTLWDLVESSFLSADDGVTRSFMRHIPQSLILIVYVLWINRVGPEKFLVNVPSSY